MTEPADLTLPPPPVEWFEDSRRLTGPNLFFNHCGAVLEAAGPAGRHVPAYQAWRGLVQAMCLHLGWPVGDVVVRTHAGGASLALAAPVDQLFSATDVNEWAWHRVSWLAFAPAFEQQPAPPLPMDEPQAQAHFSARAADERNPRLLDLLAAARQQGVAALLDDEVLSLGLGAGSQSWPLEALPLADQVPWPHLHNVPAVLVTGSNGKTTTVRLLAAMAQASGQVPGYNCTAGVFIAGQAVAQGDYSGPAGSRTVLRHPQVQLAVLETARGGLLRRGLALATVPVAVITNVSDDHFGEYGIDTLDDVASVKLIVGYALGSQGVLVLNADDPVLMRRLPQLRCSVALFALDDAHPQLQQLRAAGGSTCGVVDGRLSLHIQGARWDLGEVHGMPLSAGGAAGYNVANMAAAALAAAHLGLAPVAIAGVLASFGASRQDNPGRLERWSFAGGLTVLVDYAHNPAGLDGLLKVAVAARAPGGRLGLLLGQAGNRDDAALRELARTAAACKPDMLALKDLTSMLRGRVAGAVPALLRDELLRQGVAAAAIMATVAPEHEAAQALMAWARPGDALALPVHDAATLATISPWLDRLQARQWSPGQPLPEALCLQPLAPPNEETP